MVKTKDIHSSRPLSPHLTIYKPQITTVLSSFHRITGLALFGSLVLISWIFVFWVFNDFKSLPYINSNCKILKVALIMISYTSFFHLCTGIRHLLWDAGKFLSIKGVNITGWIAVILAKLMTIIFWLFII